MVDTSQLIGKMDINWNILQLEYHQGMQVELAKLIQKDNPVPVTYPDILGPINKNLVIPTLK